MTQDVRYLVSSNEKLLYPLYISRCQNLELTVFFRERRLRPICT